MSDQPYSAEFTNSTDTTMTIDIYAEQSDGSWKEIDHKNIARGDTSTLGFPLETGNPFKIAIDFNFSDHVLYDTFRGSNHTDPEHPYANSNNHFTVTNDGDTYSASRNGGKAFATKKIT